LYTYAPPIRILSENIVLTNIFYNLAAYKNTSRLDKNFYPTKRNPIEKSK